ncbi:type II toxin-antitoxin system RelE/ParE family toxin [Rhodoferax sp. UBA5149]|uniref:type II toxin-antitoxin system RelE/ParE family toxin n=1 Tax=Rhodoferax sp. UBA5149 TaxID=1947379 RepID=UPI0025CCEFB8|nr:type II toxin-antitoxin system RelE/ParE family toxin [Rhodoferax sp. UBA5149]
MKFDFLDLKLHAQCHDSRLATKALGAESTKKLKARLDDLDAAQSMEDMRNLPGHWEELKGDRAGQFSVRLRGGLRLIVKPQKQPPPSKPDGGLNWLAIDSLYIIEVVDYHD